MLGIFRKIFGKVSNPFTSSFGSVSRELVSEVVDKNGVPTSIHSIRDVPLMDLQALPTNREYDLAEMLKAGFNPQIVDVHGMIGSSFDVSSSFESLYNQVENSKPEDGSVIDESKNV